MLARIMREGFLAGLIGAAAVAVWFLLIDVLAGQPFYTPAMLGSALFWSLRDPSLVEITFPAVIGYTLLHVVLFSLAGTVAAALAAMVDKFPTTLFLVIVFFAIFEVGFYIVSHWWRSRSSARSPGRMWLSPISLPPWAWDTTSGGCTPIFVRGWLSILWAKPWTVSSLSARSHNLAPRLGWGSTIR